MALTVTLDLPPDVEKRLRRQTTDLESDVRQAYALDLFRRGVISHFELSALLGLDRFETDSLLKRHKIFEGSLSMADIEGDHLTLERLTRRP